MRQKFLAVPSVSICFQARQAPSTSSVNAPEKRCIVPQAHLFTLQDYHCFIPTQSPVRISFGCPELPSPASQELLALGRE